MRLLQKTGVYNMSNQPTIKDVARLAGVSIGTVDRVLHNRGRVSATNKAAVERAVESLHYRPSQVARALSIRRQNLKIGVSCPFVEQDFWTDACQGIEYATQNLQKFGVEVILDKYQSYDAAAQLQSIHRLLPHNIQGLVIVPARDNAQMLNDTIPNHIPFCTVVDDCPQSRRLFHVGPNDYASGRALAKQAMLYRPTDLKAAIIAPNINLEGTVQRVAGFRDKFIEDNLSDALLCICDIDGQTEKLSYENIYEKTLELIKVYPDLNAIYVTNGLTQWVAAALIAAGKQKDVYVFGHEYTNMTKEFLESGSITAIIYQKPANQWNLAIQLLFEYILGEREILESNINTECLLITKETLPLVQIGQI